MAENTKSCEQELNAEMENKETGVECVDSETPQGDDTQPNDDILEQHDRLIKLPITRIKHIMKTDPDVKLVNHEAAVTLAKATELFIQSLAKDATSHTLTNNRKTLQKKDLDGILDIKDCYAFLEEKSTSIHVTKADEHLIMNA